MIFYLIHFFRETLHLKVPAVFSYYSTRMILASLTALLLSILLGPFFIRKLYELKIGQTIRTDECPHLGRLHEKKKNTPTMGGVLILFAMLVSMLLWMDLKHIFTLILFVTTLYLGCVGGWDDYLKLRYKNTKGLSIKKKLCAQLLFSGCIAAYLLYPPLSDFLHVSDWYAPPVVKEHVAMGKVPLSAVLGTLQEYDPPSTTTLTLQEYASRVYMPFFKDPVIVFGGVFGSLCAVFIILVITGTSNSVNFTDGLDGLATGCLIIVASCLALIAFISNNVDIAGYLHILYIEGSGEIAIYLSALVGACLGFLWYNSHPAQVFMGDTGSLTLGGIIGVCAVLLKREFLLALVGGVFVAEGMSVIMQITSYRLYNKKRIFLCAPLHHHFEYKGWAETKVVTRFWIVGLLLAILGIASIKFQ